MINVSITFEDGGPWWRISIEASHLRSMLKTGFLNGKRIMAAQLSVSGQLIIYDFVTNSWRD